MEAAAARSFAPPEGKTRYSTLVPNSLLEQMRNIVWWERGTLSAFVRQALISAVETANAKERKLVDPVSGDVSTKPEGQSYPERRTQLKPGRPMS